MKDTPLIVIVGQTASGKSSLAHAIAKKYNGEIICADSRTVYKELSIGTAKPSKAEQDEVQYWGIDLVDPTTLFSAADFKKYAEQKIEEIRSKGKLPIMVGGTGLYVDSVLFDYTFGSEKDEKLRRLLDNKTIPELLLVAQKQHIELPNTVLKNKRHIINYIERGSSTPKQSKLRYNTLIVGLNPDRKSIRYNISERVELMFRTGLRKEVDNLVQKYGWESEAMTGIGYREFRDWYEKKISMTKVKQVIVKNTLQYAKRQRTWFKRNQSIEWFEDADIAKRRIVQFIEKAVY